MDGNEAKSSRLQARMWQSLDRRKRDSKLRSLKSSPPKSIDFSSNDFLSLSTSPMLQKAFLQELQHMPQLGSTGSRLLDGNSVLAEDLERRIADFHRGPAALLVNSGFDANVSIFSCIPQPGDIVVYDQLIHASVHDGIKSSRVDRAIAFAHNSVEDLQRILTHLKPEVDEKPSRSVFVAVESLYSMDGDLAPLQEIVELLTVLFHQKNAHLIVDEAHSTGVYGKNGRGRVCQLGLEEKVFLRLHTFGKALACNGAAIICTPLTRQYLINYARPLIYTTFMSYPALAMVKAVYAAMVDGHTEILAEALMELTESFYSGMARLRGRYAPTTSVDSLIQISPNFPISPIISLLTSDPKGLAAFCQRAGYIVRAIVAPTVPAGYERVRICLHAGNTHAQIDGLVNALGQWFEQERPKDKAQSQMMAARL